MFGAPGRCEGAWLAWGAACEGARPLACLHEGGANLFSTVRGTRPPGVALMPAPGRNTQAPGMSGSIEYPSTVQSPDKPNSLMVHVYKDKHTVRLSYKHNNLNVFISLNKLNSYE
eukprot:scaffold127582_cov52-Prasinocladus_malaysianus.AAC.1